MNRDVKEMEASLRFRELHPSLDEVARTDGLDPAKLRVALAVTKGDPPRPQIGDVHEILVTDGTKAASWHVPSLRALFRGDKIPPSFQEGPNPEYMPYFFFVEEHALLFSGQTSVPTDADFEEVYSNLRRRPDGRHFNDLHRFMWQVAVTLLGIRPVSAAEYEAIIGRLALSAAHFRTALVSRNYISVLRQNHPSFHES